MINGEFSVGVIISTYNSPAWLEKTLWGYLFQDRMADEIVIADDGSGEATKLLIDSFRPLLPIVHVWHEDNGFQKSQILNKALEASKAQYLIFTDQDCVPRRDFISTHLKYSQKGYFLSGGYFKLPMDISLGLTKEEVESGEAFTVEYLKAKNMKRSFKWSKLVKNSLFTNFMNFITPAKATWNGCNSSGWRDDAIAINGYNEQMQYGGQDREFGERLFNMGIKSKQIRYSAIALHLDHKRPYKTKESVDKNKNIRRNSRKAKIIATPYGINKL